MQADRFAKSLPCDLTREEAALKAQQLVSVMKDRQEAEEEKKEVVTEYVTRIKEYDRDLAKLAVQIRTNTEFREVECVERRNFHANTIETVRLDLGTIVYSRAMTAAERQEELDLFPRSAVPIADETPTGGSH